MSSPSSLLTVHTYSTQIQIVSVVKILGGVGAFFAPAFINQKVFGFTQRTTAGSNASASTTTPKAGSSEEITFAMRLYGAREVAIGFLLRDSATAVVERALQIGLITNLIDIAAAGIGFVEGTLSREIATTAAGVAGAFALFQGYILRA